jgi:hypothetical protein
MKAGWEIVFAEDVRVYHPRLFKKTSDIARLLRRYYFDPLLYKKHPAQYKRMIEVKKIGPFTIRRPFHLLSVVNVMSLFCSAVYLVRGGAILQLSILAYLFSLFGIMYKFTYPDFQLIKQDGFFRVFLAAVKAPFVYLFWFAKGCVLFKSFPWF